MTSKVMFGAGCFWGVQYYFDQVPGVVKTTVGYSGGHTKDPNWHNTHDQATGHAEVTLVEFDPKKVSYATLLTDFFRMHDPTTLNVADGVNIGDNYRSCIFYFDDEQQQIAEKIKITAQKNFEKPIVTEITKATEFYKAEGYHQKYAERTGHGMCHVPYEDM